MRISRRGDVFVSIGGGKPVPLKEIRLSVDREQVASTMVSMSYPREISGELCDVAICEEETLDKSDTNKGDRQAAFGSFLNKGKMW